jgi:hypothetical protein
MGPGQIDENVTSEVFITPETRYYTVNWALVASAAHKGSGNPVYMLAVLSIHCTGGSGRYMVCEGWRFDFVQ